MSDSAGLVDDLVRTILRDHAAQTDGRDDADEFDAGLWATLDDCGLTALGTPESSGGSGGTLRDVAAVLTAVGASGVMVPIAEHLLARRALASAGLDDPGGVLTCGVGRIGAQRMVDGWHLSGDLARVPWAAVASRLVVVSADESAPLVANVPLRSTTIGGGRNLAGEPRNSVTFAVVQPTHDVSTRSVGREMRLLGEIFRACLMCGAARSALELTIQHVTDRVQFGRALAAFQAVQQQIAIAAAEVELLTAAVAGAVDDAERDLDSDAVDIAGAAVKACAGRAAALVAGVSHQMHGAIGVTREHGLRLRTTRLWSWRQEVTTDGECALLLGRVGASSDEDLWTRMAPL